MSTPNDFHREPRLEPVPNQVASEQRKPTVAIVGASRDRAKFGNKSVRAHIQAGYDVYPVNPRGGEIEGLQVFGELAEIPVERLDRISMYVPPHVGIQLLQEIARIGCRELWFNPGSESAELLEKARSLGLFPIVACSIVDVGANPGQL